MLNNPIINIPNNVKKLLNMLTNSNYESYAVGGCVRDSFLENREVNDWDICTNATPEQVLEVFIDYKVIKTGLQHGTVTVLFDSEHYEVTTYRVDGEYVDNRRPEHVVFVSDLAEDLRRRDFTINALAYNENGLVDYNNGIADIENKLIKCVGNPHNRFNEDALRILRGLRFASVLDFQIEPITEKAMFDLKNNLNNISNERITIEFFKLITGVNAIEVLSKYREIIAIFIPEIQDMFEFNQNNPFHKYDVWEHTLKTIEFIPINHENSLILRLSALFHDIGKPKAYSVDEQGIGHFYKHAKYSTEITKTVLTRFKCNKDLINSVTLLVENHDRQLNDSRKNILKFLNKFSIEFLNDYLILRNADIKAQSDLSNDRLLILAKIKEISIDLINENICYKPAQLKINGSDLINLGVPQGKEVGNILLILISEVLDESLENDTNALTIRAKELII